jgi:hypothetical protein
MIESDLTWPLVHGIREGGLQMRWMQMVGCCCVAVVVLAMGGTVGRADGYDVYGGSTQSR